MQKFLKVIAGIGLALVWAVAAVQFIVPGGIERVTSSVATIFRGDGQVEIVDENIPLAGPSTDGPSLNGWLQVQGAQLTNAAGDPFRLRGMSSHGIAWYPQYSELAAIATTKTYGANLFRVAMYVDDTPGNYTTDASDKEENEKTMFAAIDNALSLDMYVIADWHVMEDGNPLNRVDDAVDFFGRLSAKYASEPGVIYEICNEPNGDGVTWEVISAYADQVIPVIQANAPDALILVGTPEFSSDLKSAMSQPLPHENIMYAYHYYSSTLDKSYATVLDRAWEEKFPVFVTEWGMGNGETALTEEEKQAATEFLVYTEAHKLSWVNWSLCNKDESFSAILPDVSSTSGWTVDDLTPSGQLIFSAFNW